MDDAVRELYAILGISDGAENSDAPRRVDGAARLTVKPVRGGTADAPVEKHRTLARRDPNCLGPKCRHTPKCEPVRIIACRRGVACDCGPVDAQRWYDERVGTRSKGTPSGGKWHARSRGWNGYMGVTPKQEIAGEKRQQVRVWLANGMRELFRPE